MSIAMSVLKTAVKELGKATLKELGASKYLKYADLFNFSKSELLKAGFSEKQILNKLSKFYLKEGWQLIINENTGQTLSRALRELKKGRLSQGTLIPKTARTQLKRDLSNLTKLTKKLGNDSLANRLLKEYEKGEINFSQLHNSLHSYVNNIEQYVNKDILINNTQLFVDNTIQETGNRYTRLDVAEMYDESSW